ncbi:MAG: gamma-glutamyl-gamma-aminobutyrate hydrolase family protein [Gammaproteobacteria bacterium]|nr:gamma-glutamyl-gamma-aminobutyrate hydrolase family protein [Gammaproteobacteria bacterium]
MSGVKPVVGIPACRKFIDPHPYHVVGEKYITAVSVASDALPVLIPALGGATDFDALLDGLDGLLITGSPSNVDPERYGGRKIEGILHDPHRDATTLPLIARAVERGVPVFAICRGCQEMNVAFGGTLHQKVHEVPGFDDHREDKSQPLEVQYGPAHPVTLTPGGLLEKLAGAGSTRVNSVHGQGIDRLGNGLIVEAKAEDGLVEAFRVDGAKGFALAVQWHPEWRVMENALSRAMFAAFGEACRKRRQGQERHDLDHAVV